MSCMCSYRCDPHCGPCGPKSRGLNWDQWPHIMLPELPQAGEGECLENCGEYSTVPHSDSSKDLSALCSVINRITYLCVLVWQWASLQQERAIFVNIKKLEKVQEQQDFIFFFLIQFLKALISLIWTKAKECKKRKCFRFDKLLWLEIKWKAGVSIHLSLFPLWKAAHSSHCCCFKSYFFRFKM